MPTNLPQLIQISLGRRETFDHKLSPAEWADLYNEALTQSLASVLVTGLERLETSYEDFGEYEDDYFDWIGGLISLEEDNHSLDEKAQSLSDVLAKAGYRSCLLKGQGVALLYPQPERRECGDIDLWMEGDRDKVLELMKSLGSVPSIDIKHAKFDYFKDASVEIHFLPTWFYSPIHNKKLQNWIRRNASAQFANPSAKGFNIPTISFNLVYSLIHTYRHLFDEGIGLRQLMDYYYILLHSEKSERAEAYKILCTFGMKRFISSAMYVLKEVLGIEDEYLLCPPSEKYGRKFLATIMEGGNFGHYSESNAHTTETRLQRGLRNLRHNMTLLTDYPSEVLWAPIWKVWHWGWRKWKGYM